MIKVENFPGQKLELKSYRFQVTSRKYFLQKCGERCDCLNLGIDREIDRYRKGENEK